MCAAPGVGDDKNGRPYAADTDVAHFAVVAARVRARQHRALENALGGLESDSVLGHIGTVLGLVPFEVHRECTYTL